MVLAEHPNRLDGVFTAKRASTAAMGRVSDHSQFDELQRRDPLHLGRAEYRYGRLRCTLV